VGSYKDLYEAFPIVREKMTEASEIIGEDLVQSFFSDNPQVINDGRICRPAIVAISTAIYEMVKSRLPQPKYFLGMSMGQIIATHCSGSITFEQSIKMVHRMASLELKAFRESDYGVYFVVNVPNDQLENKLAEIREQGHYAEPSIYTGFNQMIVSGEKKGLAQLAMWCFLQGGMCFDLIYGVPNHCSLLERVDIEQFLPIDLPVKEPAVPIICGATGEILETGDSLRSSLRRQFTGPVRWAQGVKKAVDMGIKEAVLLGPGKFMMKSLEQMNLPLTIHSFTEVDEIHI
jgi:[acyl-carrier-protein] S-malonyltransferase